MDDDKFKVCDSKIYVGRIVISNVFNKELVELLFSKAVELGLSPRMLTDYGLISITVDGREHYVFHSKSILNSQLSSYLASNKHATRVILDEHKLPNIPYCLPASRQDALQFFNEYKPVILKPTHGMRSQEVKLILTEHELTQNNISHSILEQYIEGAEERYLILNGKIVAVRRKRYDGAIGNRSLVERASLEQPEWDLDRSRIALSATSAIGLSYAAVDFIVTDNTHYILEVNSAPSALFLRNPPEGPSIDLAKMLLEATVDRIRSTYT
jgi:glutathione synthase/RimK-type ligase-like ATP-grasp enzyme